MTSIFNTLRNFYISLIGDALVLGDGDRFTRNISTQLHPDKELQS